MEVMDPTRANDKANYLKLILSNLNTLLYFLQLVITISVSIIFVTVIIVTVIVFAVVTLIVVAIEEGKNIRNDDVNHG